MLYFAKWKVILIAIVCLAGFAYSAPNFLSKEQAESLPDWFWVPHKQVNLGLDLQGGSHLLLEVDIESVVKERLEGLIDSIRVELRKARIRYQGLGSSGHSVHVTVKDADKVEEARKLLRSLEGGMDVSVDGSTVAFAYTDKSLEDLRSSVVEQTVEIIRRRIDETGVREPTIQRQGADRILVQLPGINDPERMKNLLGQTAKLTFHLVDDAVSVAEARAGRVPPGSMLRPSADEMDSTGHPLMYLLKKRVVVSGEMLTNAQPNVDQRSNMPIVEFRFDAAGGKRFGAATGQNIGKQLAILLDGKVISAPRIQAQIFSSGIITGNFTVQQTQDLALLLRAGALPAPLTILEERTVGPGLGADSIAAGKIASLIGLAAVIIFMVISYGLFGIMADVALFMNMVLIFGALSLFQATLTLPGIAGIVLTIGMAVDANVLIFERIREELRSGRSPLSSVDAGYSRALTTIIDANVTTLIAAVLLFAFGSGPVRGFAVTLAIGIVTSMFTAIMLTRFMVVRWLDAKRPKTLEV